MSNYPAGIAMLLVAALIWGTALVAQSLGMNYSGPFTFNAARFFIGGISIWLLSVISGRVQAARRQACKNAMADGGQPRSDFNAASPDYGRDPDCGRDQDSCGHALPESRRLLLKGGFLCGMALFIAVSLQQVGIAQTSVGKAGFITTLYIVMVPLLSVFLGKRVPLRVWGCIILATAGLYLLCINEAQPLNMGDVYIFLCALVTAFHLLFTDRYARLVDCLKLTCLQIFLCSGLSAICALLFEQPNLQALLAGWGPLLYTGFLSCAMAYLFQTLGQKYVNPVATSLLLSTESVFAACAGWLVLHEIMSGKEMLGCLLILAATLLAQLPGRQKSKI